LGWWLFASTSLIVISWIPYSTETKPSEKDKSELEIFWERLSHNHQNISNFILFASPKPDSRTKFCKLLQTSDWCVKKEISSSKWQQQLAADFLPSQQDLWSRMIEKYKDNSRMLFQEIQKIIWLQEYRWTSISDQELELLNYTPISIDNFKLYDKIIVWSPQESLDAIAIAKNLWDDIYQFLWWLYWYVKGLILCYYYKRDWYDSKSIASLIKYPPFTVYWFLWSMDKVQENEIFALISWILDIEYSIKNWLLDVSLFWSKLVFLTTTYKK
jgi:DNA polymerase III delta subunit